MKSSRNTGSCSFLSYLVVLQFLVGRGGKGYRCIFLSYLVVLQFQPKCFCNFSSCSFLSYLVVLQYFSVLIMAKLSCSFLSYLVVLQLEQEVADLKKRCSFLSYLVVLQSKQDKSLLKNGLSCFLYLKNTFKTAKADLHLPFFHEFAACPPTRPCSHIASPLSSNSVLSPPLAVLHTIGCSVFATNLYHARCGCKQTIATLGNHLVLKNV